MNLMLPFSLGEHHLTQYKDNGWTLRTPAKAIELWDLHLTQESKMNSDYCHIVTPMELWNHNTEDKEKLPGQHLY